MIYVYAFVAPTASVPDVPGVDGAPATLVPLGAVAAVVAEVSGAPEPTDENVLAHARVVDALAAANNAVLPARFGRGFGRPQDLELSTAQIEAELEQRLEEVSGCVEIGLHVVAEP